MSAAGLPRPTSQVEICDLNGEYITRSDFYWDEFGVVGEADGDGKYDTEGETAERQRRTETKLERTGLTVVRWGWADLFDFFPVSLRLQHAIERGVRPGSPARRWGVLLPQRRLHP